MAQIFDDILLKGIRSGQAPAKTKKARVWYRDQAAAMKKGAVSGTKLESQLTKSGQAKSRLVYGNMYMFMYDPKHKDTLPYYDRMPLIFPINSAKGGFLGINLHYLPPMMRAKLMDALYQATNNKKYDETTKLKISYDILNGAAKFKEFKPCIKHYLSNQLQSKFLYINPAEWDIALFLPSAQFVGASKQKVYADSRKIIRG
jgi:hypothetical protein